MSLLILVRCVAFSYVLRDEHETKRKVSHGKRHRITRGVRAWQFENFYCTIGLHLQETCSCARDIMINRCALHL